MAAWLNWFVLTKKVAFMQRLSDCARHGYFHYVRGEVTPEKAGYFSSKMDEIYEVGVTRLERSRKRKTHATYRLLMFHQESHQKLTWILMRTEGTPKLGDKEKWRDLRKERIVLTGYELVRKTRKESSKPAWTWGWTKDDEHFLRDSLIRAIRTKRDDQVRQLIHSISRAPGFSYARDQAKKFRQLTRAEWKRSRGSDPLPEIPERLGYVRRIPDIGMKLSELGLGVRGRRAEKPPSG
jgi:hypothetical protein